MRTINTKTNRHSLYIPNKDKRLLEQAKTLAHSMNMSFSELVVYCLSGYCDENFTQTDLKTMLDLDKE